MTKQSNGKGLKSICSFCGRVGSRTDTLIEGPDKVFICPECVELCHNIIRQNRKHPGKLVTSLKEIPRPKEIKEYLDQYVIGQEYAKSICRWRCIIIIRGLCTLTQPTVMLR